MKDNRLYLIHISESIDRIESYTASLNLQAFLEQGIVQDAVLRNLQVLAESTQHLSEGFKSDHPEIEWYKIEGLRNILVHDYMGVDLETVWAVVEDKLHDLKMVVREALKR